MSRTEAAGPLAGADAAKVDKNLLDPTVRPLYLISQLYNLVVSNCRVTRTAQPHLRRPRRSHAARDPRQTRQWRGHGHRTGQAVPNQPAGHFPAPESAGNRRTDLPRPGSAMAATHAERSPAQARGRLARAISPPLGGELRSARGVSC